MNNPMVASLRRHPKTALTVAVSVFLFLLSTADSELVAEPVIDLSSLSEAGEIGALRNIPGCPAAFKAPRELEWPTSGALAADGRLIFADILSNSVLWVDRQIEGTSGLLQKFSGFQPEDLSVIRALPDGSGYLLEDEGRPDGTGDFLYRLDNDMNVLSDDMHMRVEGRPLVDGWILDVVYDWQPVIAGGHLGVLAFADFYRGRDWNSGLVYFDEADRASIFSRYDIQSSTSYQHTQVMGYLAVVRETGYMLVYDSEPYIHEVSLDDPHLGDLSPQKTGAKKSIEVPATFRHRPVVSRHESWSTARGHEKLTALLEILEESRGASQIFAFKERLFLLGRSGVEAGTQWTVAEVTPGITAEEAKSRQLDLPLDPKAGHLTLAVGPESVGILERGHVERLGPGGWNAPYLKNRSIVDLPGEWLAGLGTTEIKQKASRCRLGSS